MSPKEQRIVLARTFREVTLSLIGLFQIYDIDQEVVDATAEALGRLFRRHLSYSPNRDEGRRCALHTLVEELDQVLEG